MGAVPPSWVCTEGEASPSPTSSPASEISYPYRQMHRGSPRHPIPLNLMYCGGCLLSLRFLHVWELKANFANFSGPWLIIRGFPFLLQGKWNCGKPGGIDWRWIASRVFGGGKLGMAAGMPCRSTKHACTLVSVWDALHFCNEATRTWW